tara:strand:+ start:1290 stop:2378 length:1089 start_codon:yes stop_codon:yes gene_type:complete
MNDYISHLSLCAGIGGVDLGLRRVVRNLSTVAMVEREAFCAANLVQKMEEGELDPCPVYTDLLRFPWQRFRGRVDIVSGGIPCQPFSVAGSRKATEDERHLWPHIKSGMSVLGNRVCFFENVDGIASAKSPGYHSVLHHVLSDLEEMGFRATAGQFSAEEVGAPHLRKRWFILGVVNSEHNGLPASTERGSIEEASGNNEEGQKASGKSKGASQPLSRGDLRGSQSMAHSDSDPCDQRQSRRTCGEVSEEGSGLRRGQSQGQAGEEPGSCGELADSDHSGCCKQWRPGAEEAEYVATECGSYPAPPGPQQFDWEPRRTIEPKLGGQSDGVPNRVDRLRALGNAVVPDVAAKAFSTLWWRLHE